MNIGTIGAILGAIASLVGIFAYLDDGVQKNKACLRAERGRVIAFSKIIEIQRKRISALESHVSTKSESETFF